MNRLKNALAATLVLALAAIACGSGDDGSGKAKPDTTPRGGTLKVVIPQGDSFRHALHPDFPPLDPQTEYSADSWEIFRCCLLRTLMSYPGRSTAEGGAQLQPDLAVRSPEVSTDGLTWTFRIRSGIRYAPPLQNIEVTASDFIRALRREARIGLEFYGHYYSVIDGFDAYAEGASDSISGLEAPDERTLVVKLVRPAGELGHLMTMAASAPIPPLATDAAAPFGVATGHDEGGFGPFLVATGPYMLEGSEKIDFSAPPAGRTPAPGLTPEKIRMVRNPSWSGASDRLRAAHVDRIEIDAVEDSPDLPAMATTGAADIVLDYRPSSRALLDLGSRVRADTSLGSVYVRSRDAVRFVAMNLAIPPFDDVAVRRAMNYALDKAAVLEALGGPLWGAPAGHIALDSLEENLLVSYDPYRTKEHRGDVAAAKREMARSRYDADQDGVCDAPACRNIRALAYESGSFPKSAAVIARSLEAIGIDLRVELMAPGELFGLLTAEARTPLTLTVAWGKDFLNASNFFTPLMSKESLVARSSTSGNNWLLLGATPEQLRSWGYSVTSVPAIDDRMDQCRRLIGAPQVRCWATLDQYLMEEVVPWVPLLFESNVWVVSPRVVAFSIDQATTMPALDRIALRPGS